MEVLQAGSINQSITQSAHSASHCLAQRFHFYSHAHSCAVVEGVERELSLRWSYSAARPIGCRAAPVASNARSSTERCNSGSSVHTLLRKKRVDKQMQTCDRRCCGES